MALVIGIAEFGLAFKDWLSVSHAAREGARVASAMGNAPTADCEVVLAAMDSIPAVRPENVAGIEIYKADASGEQIDALTNLWTPSEGDPTDCESWTVLETWPSTDRNATVGETPLDIVGVRVRVDHHWATQVGMFVGQVTFDEGSITRLEPKAFE